MGSKYVSKYVNVIVWAEEWAIKNGMLFFLCMRNGRQARQGKKNETKLQVHGMQMQVFRISWQQWDSMGCVVDSGW